ncbi:hypothetical protein DQ04_22011010 [Trypanosoma grayi]|uniref:hypothetical protein n=1 Tax=Trypanosoma grayi TaxID=71804 RepID=UPI0004F3FDFE|nr:hypothetical protein DQ04_22011010 [Trypanosoma grayi]KEG05436.1 hypothetical protein DQ04_22011010 [Trypanosoma grayi]
MPAHEPLQRLLLCCCPRLQLHFVMVLQLRELEAVLRPRVVERPLLLLHDARQLLYTACEARHLLLQQPHTRHRLGGLARLLLQLLLEAVAACRQLLVPLQRNAVV